MKTLGGRGVSCSENAKRLPPPSPVTEDAVCAWGSGSGASLSEQTLLMRLNRSARGRHVLSACCAGCLTSLALPLLRCTDMRGLGRVQNQKNILLLYIELPNRITKAKKVQSLLLLVFWTKKHTSKGLLPVLDQKKFQQGFV